MPPLFETYLRGAGEGDVPTEFGWRLVGGNGEKMTGSEGYVSRENARRGVRDVVEAVLVLAALQDHDLIEGELDAGQLAAISEAVVIRDT